MKKIYLMVMIVCGLNLNAYEVGDVIDEDVASKLQLGQELTIVDFFASWCVSCKKELPHVNALSQELNVSEVKFVGIDTDKDVNKGLAFQKKLDLKFSIVEDSKQELVTKFNPIGMPAIYYIKDKKILKIIFGAIDNIDDIIKNDIKTLK